VTGVTVCSESTDGVDDSASLVRIAGDVRASTTERDRLRKELVLSIDTPEGKQKAINNCLECHDLDNSPEFDFDTYWPQVEHSEDEPAATAAKAAASGG
jgi:hypothetical protein